MKLKSIAIMMASVAFLPCYGQETMVLKDGSQLYGHTVEEDFDNGMLTFRVDSALIVAKLSDIDYTAPEMLDLNRDVKGSSWYRWFTNHKDRVTQQRNKQYVRMGNVAHNNNARKEFDGRAVIFEQGDSAIKYFTTNECRVTLNKKAEVDHFEYDTRSRLALGGIDTELELTDGRKIRGQVVANYANKVVLLDDSGLRNVIPYKKIRAKRFLPYNENVPMAEQSPYITSLTTPDGKVDKLLLNAIVYKPLNGAKPYYDVVSLGGGANIQYPFDMVSKVGSTVNQDYVEDTDVVMEDDEVLVNRIPAEPIQYVMKSDRYEITDTVGAVRVSEYDLVDGMLKVHFRDPMDNTEFFFVEARPYNQYLELNYDNRKKKKDDGEETVYYYTNLSDVLMNGYTAYDKFVSPAGNVSVNYGQLTAGKAYMLIRKSAPLKPAYLIIVTF
ncbi:MAG: hypothetical protein NC114_12090 [Ruminococcus flavefaciens]|nr:hypothetical protein [Ruminococcus flavefaciens]